MIARTLVALIALTACPSSPPEPTETDTGEPPDDSPSLVNGCAEDDLEACVYTPVVTASAGGFKTGSLELDYRNEHGDRTIAVEVRLPDPAPTEPAPVVLWSHGGSKGRDDATTVGVEVGQVLNAAGYIAVMIGHTRRDRTGYRSLCEDLGLTADDCAASPCDATSVCERTVDGEEQKGSCFVDEGEDTGVCGYFKHLYYDRAQDVRAVLDWVETQNASGTAAGSFDLERIAYAGHSGGSGGTFMVAGATRSFAGVPTLVADPRPIAFFSGSPQGPGTAGFDEDSYSGAGCTALAPDAEFPCLTRPHLVMTGDGDVTDEHVPEGRRQAYDTLREGDKMLAYLLEEGAGHNTFQLKPDACDASVGTDRCLAIQGALGGVLQAFLDAHVRDAPEARAYLDSDNAMLLLGGDLETQQK